MDYLSLLLKPLSLKMCAFILKVLVFHCLPMDFAVYKIRDFSPLGSSVHGDSPGKNTGGGCHVLPQGVFLIQGLKLHH